MRIAIDLTNSPHVPVFAPIVRRLQASGHDVVLTARRFAQTVELAHMHGLDVHVIGSHGGATRLGKARAAAVRTILLWRYLRRLHQQQPFDVAWSHGSTDLPLACARLDIPHVTMFDYEWATTMHRTNIRNSWKVLVPDAIDASRLDQYRAAGKTVFYPGLKESYYLSDVELDPNIRSQLGVPDDDVLVVLRPPPEMALYHRGHGADHFADLLDRCASEPSTTVVVLPRTPDQRERVLQSYGRDAGVIVPERAIDALSLLDAADVAVSAGGTMNREAVALGVPVYTVFAGRMGGVDERLITEGLLHQLDDPRAIPLVRRDRSSSTHDRILRDPADLIDRALSGLAPAPR